MEQARRTARRSIIRNRHQLDLEESGTNSGILELGLCATDHANNLPSVTLLDAW